MLSCFEAVMFHMGILGGSVVKDPLASAGDAEDPRSIPGLNKPQRERREVLRLRQEQVQRP